MDPSPHNDSVKRICVAVAAGGWCIEERFAARWLVDALRIELQRRKAAGEFRVAGVGRGRARVERPDVRGDRIAWLDEARLSPTEQALCDMLGQLRRGLNRTTLLGLFSLEAHYALYPAGAFYRRHRDRFRDDDARVLSWVLYLNDGWSAADGGALRIHLSGSESRDVVPAAGTLACFLSDRFEHEVLPATRERWSITGWFRRYSVAGHGSADTILRGRDP
jgi:SM-20-related protein